MATTKSAKPNRKPAKKPSARQTMVSVEILQNGISVANMSKPYGRTGDLAITSKATGPLAIPMYPIADDLKLLRSSKKKTYLTLSTAWEGFAVMSGRAVDFAATDRSAREYQLAPGDYASLLHGDLRVLIRVSPERKKTKPIALAADYRATPLAMLVRDKTEIGILAIAATIGLCIYGLFALGLHSIESVKPKKIEELAAPYTVPFISKDHFETSPEILQSKLDRRDYVSSIVNFYRAYAGALANGEFVENSGVFPSTAASYRQAISASAEKIEFFKEKQKKIEDTIKSRPLTGVLVVPTVLGESVEGTLQRLIDKVGIAHQSARHNLKIRQEFLEPFISEPEYNFDDYRSGPVKDKTFSKIAKISVNEMPDEKEMYLRAENLGKQAIRAQAKHTAMHSDLAPSSKYGGPIEIPAGIEYASFLGGSDYILSDEKLDEIRASEYGTTRKIEVIREPLIGEIEPGLVEKTIQKHRFELQLCFELALRRNQLARGTMEWKWRIDSRGAISDISLVSSSIEDRKMIDCIRDKMGKWRFPRPRRGSIEVSYPFEFNPTRG